MKKLLSANTIKLIAIAAMTLDHIAWWLFPGYPREALPLLLHMIGRITCPVMCYFIAEGYHHTRDIHRYTRRLFGLPCWRILPMCLPRRGLKAGVRLFPSGTEAC